MVRILGISFGTFFKKLISEPLVLFRILLLSLRGTFQKARNRLDIFDPRKTEAPQRGPFFTSIEKEVERPARLNQGKVIDSVLVFGVNSLGDRLVARVSREREGHLLWLYLRLSDGRIYQPIQAERTYPLAEDYVAGGLKIKCLVPLRRWRLSYNGVLRESKDGSQETRTVHVQFSFLCLSTAIPLDLRVGVPLEKLLGFVVNNTKWPHNHQTLLNQLDRIVQAVNFIGTLKVGDVDEIELNLWGLKQKTKDLNLWDRKSSSSLKEVLGYSKDGQVFYTGEYHLPYIQERLVFGVYLERSGLSWPTVSCNINFGISQAVFSGVWINMKTERSATAVYAGKPKVTLNLSAGLNKGFAARAHITELRAEDGDPGHTLTMEYNWRHSPEDWTISRWILPILFRSGTISRKFALTLEDTECQSPILTGGKGSSLAALTYLAKKYPTKFSVPKGFVLTTAAYKEFYSSSGIEAKISLFESSAWRMNHEELKASCLILVKSISEAPLPESVQKEIVRLIEKEFPGEILEKRFAVRSSATGEDSEDMSAAGQMSTFLGLLGMENIFAAIVKCWASQFSFTAVQYKRQNGQKLNSMMAVVVQEMVPSDTAGVLFTCDPVTGNPQHVTITANFGIGESVVSASAEPDTVVLLRNELQELSVTEAQVGRKSLKVVMSDEGGVVEEQVADKDRSVSCISDVESLSLAETSLKVEEAFGCPLDIEWAFRGGQLYLLQARPITTFDKETPFEILHAVDDPTRIEEECNTSANAGEVMPRPASHLGITFLMDAFPAIFQGLYGKRNPYCFPFTPFENMVVKACNYCLLSMPNFVLRFYSREEKSFLAEASLIAGFGRILDDEDMYDQLGRKNKTFPATFLPYQLIFFIKDMLFGGRTMKKCAERLSKETFDVSHCKNAREMYSYIWKKTMTVVDILGCHFTCSLNSTLYNNVAMSVIRSANNEWSSTVFTDFSLIMSSCGGVESADVPESVQKLAETIRQQGDAEYFKNMSDKEALNWLQKVDTPAGQFYHTFLKRHGHRCLMEMDLYRKPWRINKLPLIKVFQDAIDVPYDKKPFVPVSEVIEKCKSPLSRGQKLFLRLLIPLCRKYVMGREKSKSLFVKTVDSVRPCFWALSEQMVKEGFIPEKELMFFLSTHEVLQLIQTRNPLLVQKAVRRKMFFPELDNLRFPELTKGVPKPLNWKNKIIEDLPSDLEMKGTPVSQGVVKGYARVAVKLEEATSIKPGEILIAYGTDIGWSPYFPLLTGIATELGGLISHGAVVAREYGLPSVVGLFDATLKFKTGDYVLLDGNKGILKRIPQITEENGASHIGVK